MSIADTADLERAPYPPIILRLAVSAVCAGLADWLFFGWDVGISLALFYGVLGVTAIACNRVHASRRLQVSMTAIFIAGLIALIEDVDFLSVMVATLATAMFVIVMTARQARSWPHYLLEAAVVPLRGPFQFLIDVTYALRYLTPRSSSWLRSLVGWIIPLGALSIFVGLFFAANPLIEIQLQRIDLLSLLNVLASWHLVFWIAIMCAIWPLIHRRIKRSTSTSSEPVAAIEETPARIDHLFGVQAVTRSLVLFNALFALQTVLDLIYLWGGRSLPGGMNHAEYAHRGAYPLVATALLAAGFVLVAMRRDGPAEQSRLIRPLVLAWIGQNILLVISSVFRLDLYIDNFSLTYLRLAAFIWMALVAIGLMLILLQIILGKSSSWLLTANAISLAVVLYGCCFLNAPWLVSYYNVEHCHEARGTGSYLDINYLTSLNSPQTLQPVEAHLREFPGTYRLSVQYRTSPDRRYFSRPGNWRAWSFRAWRLERYFANTPIEKLDPSNDFKDQDRG